MTDTAALRKAAETFNRIINQVENRCMAVDGPVTTTLKEMTGSELRELWLAVQTIPALLDRLRASPAPPPVVEAVRAWFNKLPCDGIGKDHFDALVGIITASPADRVSVKPLEWVSDIGYGPEIVAHEADALGLSYCIIERDDGFALALRTKAVNLGFFGTLDQAKAAAQADYEKRILSALSEASKPAPDRVEWPASHSVFAPGDRVEKIKGSSWHGTVCGWYRTELTPEGYCVESEREPGSVQLYPVAALSEASK